MVLLGHTDEAIATCEKAAGLARHFLVQLYLVAAYANKGDMAKAAAAKVQVLKMAPDYTIARMRVSRLSDVRENLKLEEANLYPGLRKAGIPEQ